MAYLSLTNISKNFENVVAVKDFNLNIEKGQLVSFLGPSGCGKTTTLRMIAGFEIPDTGTIFLDGVDISNIPPNKRDIGMVFQAYALFPNMNVRENIMFGLKMQRRPKDEMIRRAENVLSLIRLENTAKRYPHQLSGGQRQRIALARALAIEPRVLLLDEPLSALDAEVRVVLRGEIRRIQSDLGITTVYVTHDQEEALSISDVVVVMNNGLIEQVGSPQEIYRKPNTRFVATFIGTANEFHGFVSDSSHVQCDEINIYSTRVGKLATGVKVVLLVRPENVEIYDQPPGRDTQNVFEGKIDTITFHGAITRLGINASGKIITADVSISSRAPVTHNQHVWLSFDPEYCQVMAE
ncbi:MAG: spermidine/putrescine ABC transporter ATP-binding protein [Chloroflexi bacterium 44-23]|nr:MAG: spermidine/putrescine ABC transporter ATP-binding protein [Chloroflexi bacterium 44-23]